MDIERICWGLKGIYHYGRRQLCCQFSEDLSRNTDWLRSYEKPNMIRKIESMYFDTSCLIKDRLSADFPIAYFSTLCFNEVSKALVLKNWLWTIRNSVWINICIANLANKWIWLEYTTFAKCYKKMWMLFDARFVPILFHTVSTLKR